ncbi:MAG: CdaR family protein [Bryobacteraceae bacterium]
MKTFLTHNVGWKLLSLAAAILLWIGVASEPELSTFVSAPVEYRNLSKEIEITSNVVESVLLEVRGPSLELRGFPDARQRYVAVLDMTSIGPGEHTFTIGEQEVRLPRGIRLVRVMPAQIRLSFERSATRPVPVEPRIAGNLPANLRVIRAEAEPADLRISGPVSNVARVRLIDTDAITLQPEAGVQEFQVDAFVTDPRVHFEDRPRVTVKVTVGPK